MLFFPIDQKLLLQQKTNKNAATTKQKKHFSPSLYKYINNEKKRKSQHLIIQKRCSKSSSMVMDVKELDLSIGSVATKTGLQKVELSKDIQNKSNEANILIDYMRDISEQQSSASPQHRVMTTMNPSTKDRLKKNLETFSRYKNPKSVSSLTPQDPSASLLFVNPKLFVPVHT